MTPSQKFLKKIGLKDQDILEETNAIPETVEQENSRRFAAEKLGKSEPRATAVRRPQEGVKRMPLQHDNGRNPTHPIDECDPGFGRGQHVLGVLSV